MSVSHFFRFSEGSAHAQRALSGKARDEALSATRVVIFCSKSALVHILTTFVTS